MRRTKIVCTLGPASERREQIEALLNAGMDVARLNFSHGDHDWHAERLRMIRSLAQARDQPIAVLQDLAGPKIRIGEIPGGGVQAALGGALRGLFVRAFLGHFELGPVRAALPAVAEWKCRDPNMRPAEVAAMQRLVARESRRP